MAGEVELPVTGPPVAEDIQVIQDNAVWVADEDELPATGPPVAEDVEVTEDEPLVIRLPVDDDLL